MRKTIPVLLLLLLLMACQTAAPDVPTDSTSPDDGAVVVFARSGGVDGATTTWRVYPDGRVTVAVEGEETRAVSVPPGRVEEVLAGLENAGFFALDGNYMPEDTCCDRFHYRLTADNGEQSNTIETLEATQGIPLNVWQSIGVLEKFIFQDVNEGES